MLSRKLYPGKYILEGKKKNLKKINYFKIEKVQNHPLNFIRKAIRDRIFFLTLNIDDDYRGLLLSIILNEKLPSKFKFLYELGLGHYFAISGLHISILLSLFSFNSLILNLIILILLLAYSLIIFSPSILRAFLFAFFKILSLSLGEERDKKREFIISLFICITIFGYNSFSLQLTFLASSVFIFFPNKSFYMNSLLISLMTFPCILFHMGNFNLLAFIPNILLSSLFYFLIILCFLNIVIPLNTIIVILIKIILSISYFCEKFISLNITYKIPLYLLVAFYLIFIVIYLRKR